MELYGASRLVFEPDNHAFGTFCSVSQHPSHNDLWGVFFHTGMTQQTVLANGEKVDGRFYVFSFEDACKMAKQQVGRVEALSSP